MRRYTTDPKGCIPRPSWSGCWTDSGQNNIQEKTIDLEHLLEASGTSHFPLAPARRLVRGLGRNPRGAEEHAVEPIVLHPGRQNGRTPGTAPVRNTEHVRGSARFHGETSAAAVLPQCVFGWKNDVGRRGRYRSPVRLVAFLLVVSKNDPFESRCREPRS